MRGIVFKFQGLFQGKFLDTGFLNTAALFSVLVENIQGLFPNTGRDTGPDLRIYRIEYETNTGFHATHTRISGFPVF